MYNSYVQYIVIYVLWQFNPKSFIYKNQSKGLLSQMISFSLIY